MSEYHNQDPQRTNTRRHFVQSVTAAGSSLLMHRYANAQPKATENHALPDGLEIRDFRLFPTGGVMRFIVEVFNDTDQPIDTPTLGVVVPDFPSDQNYGWASPMQGVIHPKSSSGLIGVAPMGVVDDDSWGSPQWILCAELSTRLAESIQSFDVEIEAKLNHRNGSNLVVDLTFLNTGTDLDSTVTILGLIRDEDGRLCGGTYPIGLGSIPTGAEGHATLWLGSYYDFPGSHDALIDNSDGLSVELSLQPFIASINTGCSPIMPWNR